MQAVARLWRGFLTARSADEDLARQEYLTRVMLLIVTLTMGAFLVVFVAGWRLGLFSPGDVHTLLIVCLAVGLADALTHYGKWRWASYLLPALFWGLASSLTYEMSLWSPAPLFYAPAILLAGALVGDRAQWLALGVSLVGFALFGWFGRGDNDMSGYLATLIASSAPLVAVALVQRLNGRLLRGAYRRERAAADRLRQANAALEAEMTERQRAEAALRASEAKYRAIIEAIPVGMHQYELQPDGRLVLTGVNPAAERILGFDHSPLIGQTIEQAFPPLADTELPNHYRRAAAQGEPWSTRQVSYQDGRIASIYEVTAFQTAPGRMTAAFMDVAERERAIEELRLLYAAIEQAEEAVVITSPEGVVRYINPAVERSTGFGGDVVGAFGFDGSVAPIEVLTPIAEALRAGQSWSGRFTGRKKGPGAEFQIEMTASPVRDEVGRVTHFVFVGRDISAQAALEDQLRQAQKMEAVGQLAGGVAHDFNNLLQVIQGYAELARQDLGRAHPVTPQLDEVMAASQRATTLVRQLLTFSRREMLTPAYLNLTEVVTGLLKMLRRVIGEHIELRADLAPGLPTIYADAGQVEQALMNLCVNARDAMPNGGQLTIRTGRALLTPAFAAERPWARAGDFVTLSVADAGVGMTAEVLGHIFEPFFTTKGPQKGTGLGLATVYGVVKQHEGLVEVQSAVGQGSTFTLYLPVAEAPAAPAPDQAVAVEADDSRGHGECILVAEDEELVRHLAQVLLTRAGYRVIAARDGREAVQAFTERGGEIALALLDVVMPGLSGRAVAEAIRVRAPQLPILFCSGYDFQMLEDALAPDERAHLVHKPYNPAELLRRVRQALRK